MHAIERGETLPQAAFNLEGLSSFQFEVLLMAEIPNNHLVCKNPRNNGRSYLSTGAGFQPSTPSRTFNVMKSIQSFNFQQPDPDLKAICFCMNASSTIFTLEAFFYERFFIAIVYMT